VKNKILPRLITEGGNVDEIIENEGLAQISDENAIKKHVEEILARSQDQVESYRSGKTKVRQFFFGEVMKATRGKANPKVINELLDQLLPEPEQR
jgi:aspartyl-tRNA(Asn)/glutamyl-tRNA(Gln) amidotransferase subunit B